MRLSHRIWAGILLGIVAGNAIGLGSYILLRDEAKPAKQRKADDTVDAASKAHRLAGLDAVERGDHEAAIAEFSAGLRSPNPAPDLPQLLSIAQKMRERELERIKEEADAAAAREAEAQQESAVVNTADAEQADRQEEAEREKKPPTLILVTSRPTRLAIEVDGKLRDMTPAKLEVKPGTHKVVLRQGRDRLYERTVRVKKGQVALVDADVSDAFAPPPPPPPEDEPDPADEADLDLIDDAVAATPSPEGSTPGLLRAFPGREATAAAADQATLLEAADRDPGASAPPDRAEPSAPDASVTAPPPAAPSGGTLPPEAIRRAVARYERYFQDCYDDYRRVRPNLAGRVVIEVDVQRDGEVRKGRVRESTLKGSGRINACLERAARRMEFAEPEGGPTTVSFALRFRPNG